ncbi:hypothetical protein HDU90_006765 [Geranomyces variabilis]|nr:hypothetical protein HDU90_006765 [Geranomyces variabilis]
MTSATDSSSQSPFLQLPVAPCLPPCSCAPSTSAPSPSAAAAAAAPTKKQVRFPVNIEAAADRRWEQVERERDAYAKELLERKRRDAVYMARRRAREEEVARLAAAAPQHQNTTEVVAAAATGQG